MARRQAGHTVTLSVLDRLIDKDPKNSSEAPLTRSQAERALKNGVRRDLEWLLNTRRVAIEPDESLGELNKSLYVYGLPDFSAYTAGSPRDQAKLLRAIQVTLRLFEPRLVNVQLVPVEGNSAGIQALRLRIEGMLLMDPGLEHVSFDTVIEPRAARARFAETLMRDELLLYYERELDYLRKMAADFAEENPKIASRLAIGPAQVEDPFVERLLEAFAFLAARVHLKIDDEFPEISEALLSIVYPHLIQPIPSMSVVEFQLDPEKGKLSTGLKIERNSVLRSRPVGGVPCTFRTAYDTTLWPLTVASAEWKPPSRLQPPLRAADAVAAIRLELRCAPDVTLPALKLDELRFYLHHGDSGIIHALYELLCSRLSRIVIRDLAPGTKVSPVSLPASCLRPVGFAAHEGMLPYTRRSFIGHRLLQEYFIFPEKFFFVDVTGAATVWEAGFKDAAELIFLFSEVEGENRRERLEVEISSKVFRLGCAPIVNLFPLTADPVQLSQRKYEYPLVPDVRSPDSIEVFSVDEVVGMNTRTQETVPFEPFYSFRHSTRPVQGKCFWLARRRPSGRGGSDATDIYLSLVDLSIRPADPDADILTVRATCTNRDLPARLPFGSEDADFECEGVAALKRVVTLKKPTAPVRPPVGKAALWRLISHLSLNYLSLVEEGREALQQILKIYDFTNSAYSENIIEGVTSLKSMPRFAGVLSENGIAFARGTRVEMELDEDQFVGGGVYLFASVLEQFLGLYASLNSFSQLAVRTRQRRGLLREWPPRAGRRILL